MVQEIAEHETSGLVMPTRVTFNGTGIVTTLFLEFFVGIRLFDVVVIDIFFVIDSILSSLLVELPLHQYVEEHSHGCHVGEFTIDVDRPKEGVLFRIVSIRETYQVDCYVAEHVFVVQSTTNGLADLGQVDLGQTSLRSETASIDKLSPRELVAGTNKLYVTVRLNKEGD